MTDVTLTESQARAVSDIVYWFRNKTKDQQVYYLAGFAGVGKSTVVKHIVEALNLSFSGFMPSVVAATYTAKAALVLTRFGTPATTIHKLIYISRRCTAAEYDAAKVELDRLKLEAMQCEDQFERQMLESDIAARTLELKEMRGLQTTLNEVSRARDAKLIIIDEVSMCGQKEGMDLLSFGRPILVVGDPGQLPPIHGQGFFTSRTPDMFLTEIHRQAVDNPIIRLATMAREGRFIPFGRYSDAVWKMPRAAVTEPKMLLMADQVICGFNHTRFMLNNDMRAALGFDGVLPLPQDKVICLQNKYDFGVINGLFMTMKNTTPVDDRRFQAIIVTEDGDIVGDKVKFGDGYEGDELPTSGVMCYSGHYQDHLMFDRNRDDRDWKIKPKLVESTFGYVISCHKAQGSGFGKVIVWDDGWGYRPSERRKWLYTAITRAVDGLLIVE